MSKDGGLFFLCPILLIVNKDLTFNLIYDIIISRYYDIINGGDVVNKSNIPTYQKVMIPLRLPPDVYKKMIEKVQNEKKSQRGYSINQFLTSLVEKELEGK